ncbi:hypothetical protein Lal_00030231 [Lupinus albus]|nr:hypothetical protein Lal_00030231 [Lupinus albus]
MTTNLAECINGVLKGSRALPITALVKATYYRLNEWFIEHRNEASNMIKARHVYYEELTKKINDNLHVIWFVRFHGKPEYFSRQVRVYTVRLANNWCDCGEFQSIKIVMLSCNCNMRFISF